VAETPGASNFRRPLLTGDLAGGTVRALVFWPDPRLRQRCEPAGYLPRRDQRRLVADLLETLYHAAGRGLAAPQVGAMWRVFVMDAGWKAGRPEPLVALDPEILSSSETTEIAEEQCLSIPGRPVLVRRPRTITLGWYDLDGRHHLRQMSGPEARIAQHEVDHLDGRLIVED